MSPGALELCIHSLPSKSMDLLLADADYLATLHDYTYSFSGRINTVPAHGEIHTCVFPPGHGRLLASLFPPLEAYTHCTFVVNLVLRKCNHCLVRQSRYSVSPQQRTLSILDNTCLQVLSNSAFTHYLLNQWTCC